MPDEKGNKCAGCGAKYIARQPFDDRQTCMYAKTERVSGNHRAERSH
jgi:hypothetical protein